MFEKLRTKQLKSNLKSNLFEQQKYHTTEESQLVNISNKITKKIKMFLKYT